MNNTSIENIETIVPSASVIAQFYFSKDKEKEIFNKIRRFYTLNGTRIKKIYEDNRMAVHNQGHYRSVASPQAIAKEGTLTLSLIVSHHGTVTGIIDSGSLIFLNDNPLRMASIPFVCIDNNTPVMLTSYEAENFTSADDFPLPQNYYYDFIAQKNISISLATPLAQLSYRIGKTEITRRIIPPLLSSRDQFTPVTVEQYILHNRSNSSQQITLVVPMPSLVNLSRKNSRPCEQDYTFLGYAAINGQVHSKFNYQGITGVEMSGEQSSDRMVIAVPVSEEVKIDIKEAFKLRTYKQDLVLNSDGSFHHPNAIEPGNDYGSAISITVNVEPGQVASVPVVKAFDFPFQKYADGVSIQRRYATDYLCEENRAKDMAVNALNNYPEWLERTITVQEHIYSSLQSMPMYKNDTEGALRAARLLFNELSYLLSNASVLDQKDQARFLECFDYPFNNSADVDFYSKLLLSIFPQFELELCEKFIDSINKKDEKFRFYNQYFYDPVLQRNYLQQLERENRQPGTDIHIYASKKEEGSVFHDLGSLTFGNPLRNISEYTWFNTSYWIDLFPKLALRTLRNVKYTGKTDVVSDNWITLKKGFNYLMSMDYDHDGIPEGRPGEVRNTYDNIPFAGVGAYDANLFVASLKAMTRMADMVGDISEKNRYIELYQKAFSVYDSLWYETTDAQGNEMAYYITCSGVNGQGKCTDVFTDQIVGLWQWIAMGEKPFLPENRVKRLLKTIYINNRTPMGWATARKQDGSAVDSDQGKDVWIASNYVLAQMLSYYEMYEESKEIYKKMDEIIFEHGNSLNTAESVRPEYEKQPGEKKTQPHYIVASYPRPGAVYDILYLEAIKREWEKTPDVEYIDSQRLQSIRKSIFQS
ncbi:MAG: hypothetical protein GX267_10875 [Fibrobacter sp.]|jgi:uncharacterized protein (DUF608 family)|nr:hypothetical protein [Fibrobacter sp.]